MIRVDLHLHSSASFDCRTEPESVAERCRRLGLGPIFLTDHDTIAGATLLQAAGEHRVVAGEEVMTQDLIDIVEVFNGRSDSHANRRAEDLCAVLNAAPGAGSDAHTLQEMGSVFVEMDDFVDRTFLPNCAAARS